jgi:hypothetical protein
MVLTTYDDVEPWPRGRLLCYIKSTPWLSGGLGAINYHIPLLAHHYECLLAIFADL